jgi:hypothetical protein
VIELIAQIKTHYNGEETREKRGRREEREERKERQEGGESRNGEKNVASNSGEKEGKGW